MGAHNFYDEATGKTAKEAYRNAKDEANARNGHQEGYSGDIQTTSGFRMVTLKEGQSFNELEDEVLDDPRFDKRGDCACLEKGEAPSGSGNKLYAFFGWAAS